MGNNLVIPLVCWVVGSIPTQEKHLSNEYRVVLCLGVMNYRKCFYKKKISMYPISNLVPIVQALLNLGLDGAV